MKRIIAAIAVAVTLTLTLFVGGAAATAGKGDTFTLVCTTQTGTQTYTVVDLAPHNNAAVFTNGTMIFAIVGPQGATGVVPCTIDGNGPYPFVIKSV
jgi:hypothetical protein